MNKDLILTFTVNEEFHIYLNLYMYVCMYTRMQI